MGKKRTKTHHIKAARHESGSFQGKFKEALSSVLPVTAIVLVLHWFLTPLPGGTLGLFLFGALFLILGMTLFTMGADMAMMPMGERVGAKLTGSRKLWLLIPVCFLIGMLITVAEPDLTVLAEQIPSVPNRTLILTVSVGVGAFLVFALLRIVFAKRLNLALCGCYLLVFALAAFAPQDFLAVAFDSGGVTTGPITVPFIMALGLGVAAVHGGKHAREDSFGLVAMSSVGPILAVLILGFCFGASSSAYMPPDVADPVNFAEGVICFASAFPIYAKEVAVALLPIVAFFAIFMLLALKTSQREILRLGVGVLYTFAGLVLFLTGVNVGFLPAGYYLGGAIANVSAAWLIPIGMLMGFFVVMAEPAVHVLNRQVEEITVGAISKSAMLLSLSFGVAVSIGISMLRVITGVSIWYFLLGGYALAIALSFVSPKIFTAIAFDSGGVASGPMTATFLLPFATGACGTLGGNVLTDAFGLVAMVAMTPLLTIQILGLIYQAKMRRARDKELAHEDNAIEIIEFEWRTSNGTD